MQDIYSDSSDVIQVAPTAQDTKSIPVWIKLLVLFLCLVGLVCGGGMLTGVSREYGAGHLCLRRKDSTAFSGCG